MSNMPDSNRNWKGIYFFVQGTDWVCHPEEWGMMPHDFDNTWGIIKDPGLASSVFALTFSIYLLSVLMSSISFSAKIRLNRTDKPEAFIRRVLKSRLSNRSVGI